ncbi:hypothetical protein AT302_27165 [Pandoraea norimbergensis]|nr:hypothetical protein AT302_27165 [Pandoraea norimbergensis]
MRDCTAGVVECPCLDPCVTRGKLDGSSAIAQGFRDVQVRGRIALRVGLHNLARVVVEPDCIHRQPGGGHLPANVADRVSRRI